MPRGRGARRHTGLRIEPHHRAADRWSNPAPLDADASVGRPRTSGVPDGSGDSGTGGRAVCVDERAPWLARRRVAPRRSSAPCRLPRRPRMAFPSRGRAHGAGISFGWWFGGMMAGILGGFALQFFFMARWMERWERGRGGSALHGALAAPEAPARESASEEPQPLLHRPDGEGNAKGRKASDKGAAGPSQPTRRRRRIVGIRRFRAWGLWDLWREHTREHVSRRRWAWLRPPRCRAPQGLARHPNTARCPQRT
jgi:hypothetical protein